MVIKCTLDGHRHPVPLEELDVSEPAVWRQCADGRKGSICVETVALPSLCSFRFMASETPKTFPFYMRVSTEVLRLLLEAKFSPALKGISHNFNSHNQPAPSAGIYFGISSVSTSFGEQQDGNTQQHDGEPGEYSWNHRDSSLGKKQIYIHLMEVSVHRTNGSNLAG
eukprot:bmy_07082T0